MPLWTTVAYESGYALASALNAFRPYAALAHALGRTHGCSIDETVAAFEHRRLEARHVARYERECALIGRDGELEQWRTPDGDWWIPQNTSRILFVMLAEAALNIYGDASGVCLDCGANIGVWTRSALRSGASLVVAIEPESKNNECLRRNLAGDIAARRVLVCPAGVWDKEETVPMYANPGHAADASVVMRKGRPRPIGSIPLTTIDKLVADLRLPRVDFIKMDIEGAERRAILGASETIRRCHPRMAICVYHLPDDPQEIPAAVHSLTTYETESRFCNSRRKITPEVHFFS